MLNQKFVVLIFLLVFNSEISFSQSSWEYVFPKPTPNGYFNTNKLANGNFLLIGNHGTIVKYDSGDSSLDFIYSPLDGTLSKSFFINSQTGWIVGGTPALSSRFGKTTNGGLNWTPIPVQSGVGSIFGLDFFSEEIGFIYSTPSFAYFGTKAFHTTNSGISFEEINMPSKTASFRYIKFFNSQSGIIVETPYGHFRVFKTSDQGKTWTLISETTTPFFTEHFYSDESTGYYSADKKLYKTIDGGKTYQVILSFPEAIKYSYRIYGNEIVVIVLKANSTIVNKSTDGGVSWNSNNYTEIYSSGNNFTFDYNSNEIILAENNRIHKLDLNSNSSSILSQPTRSFTRTFLFDENNFIAYKEDSVFTTTNSGSSWNGSNFDDIRFSNIFILDENTCYASAFSKQPLGSFFMKSYNRGLDWEIVHNNPGNFMVYVQDLQFIDKDTGFIVSGNEVFRTRDGGSNWYKINNLSTHGIYFKNAENGFSYYFNHLLKTTNSGNSWHSAANFGDGRITSIYFIDDQNGVLATLNGIIRKTSDGGDTWSFVSQDENLSFRKILFTDTQNGYAITQQNFYKTTDGGLTWKLKREFTGYRLNKINTKNGIKVYVNGATFLYSNVDLISSIEPNSNEVIPTSFSLSQNYPNPFNPVTKIKFSLPSAQFTKLKVYNLLGQEVSTLVNQHLQPGSYEYTFDGGRFASGVYLYRLEAGEFVETKRMLLLK